MMMVVWSYLKHNITVHPLKNYCHVMKYHYRILQSGIAYDTLLYDIKEDTVDFVSNFDGNEMEPLVLPARVPMLLLNGASGIAVGMATNIPPHNLGELCDGVVALIDNPTLSEEDLIKLIPAPDFPTVIQSNFRLSDQILPHSSSQFAINNLTSGRVNNGVKRCRRIVQNGSRAYHHEGAMSHRSDNNSWKDR